MKTEYLLRFDDLTPGMDRARWERFVPLLERFGVKPILAVVPENRDPQLRVTEDDAGFWDEMREWQRRGAAIGLHGYRHLCWSEGRGRQGRRFEGRGFEGRGFEGLGLVPLHLQTEFAGAPEADQRAWIEAGLGILRGHGLEPRIWVAPRHGSDAATVRALRRAGIEVISDGLWRRPVTWHEAVWIPQQIWEPHVMPGGLWTICLHAGTASDALVTRLEGFLNRNAGAFTSVERVLAEWPVVRYGVRDWARQAWWLAKRRIRQGIGNGE